MVYNDILNFWFDYKLSDDWFKKNEALDLKMVEKFIVIHSQAVLGELYHWRSENLGRLAEIILIDQFSRNIYRDDPKAFASDSLALVLAEEAIDLKINLALEPRYKQFLYMPYMHSESIAIHEIAISLFSCTGLEKQLEQELSHKKIIEQFGRFPERNKILGRQNTIEEEVYLKAKGKPEMLNSNLEFSNYF